MDLVGHMVSVELLNIASGGFESTYTTRHGVLRKSLFIDAEIFISCHFHMSQNVHICFNSLKM